MYAVYCKTYHFVDLLDLANLSSGLRSTSVRSMVVGALALDVTATHSERRVAAAAAALVVFPRAKQLIPADTRDVYDAGRYAVLWWHAIEARVAMRGVRERAVRSIRIARLLSTKK